MSLRSTWIHDGRNIDVGYDEEDIDEPEQEEKSSSGDEGGFDFIPYDQAFGVKEFLIGMVKVTVKVFFISKGKGNAISNCEVEKNNSDCFSLEWQNIVVVCFSSLLLPEINVKLLFWEN